MTIFNPCCFNEGGGFRCIHSFFCFSQAEKGAQEALRYHVHEACASHARAVRQVRPGHERHCHHANVAGRGAFGHLFFFSILSWVRWMFTCRIHAGVIGVVVCFKLYIVGFQQAGALSCIRLQMGVRPSMSEMPAGPLVHYRPKSRSLKNTPVSILWSYLHHRRWIWSMPAGSERSSFVPTTSTLVLESILKA